MFDIDHIVQTALSENNDAYGDSQQDSRVGCSANSHDDYLRQIKTQLGESSKIPAYSKSSAPLSLVSFECLLQDTGYPMEVYLPGDDSNKDEDIDWSRLRERWVGWGVEIPGRQHWTMEDEAISRLEGLSLNSEALPTAVKEKYPLPEKDGRYLGALIKVYSDAAYKPASTYRFLGILSQSSMPFAEHDDAEVVPAIHVLDVISTEEGLDISSAPTDEQTREGLVNYLATAFEPYDRLAAEYLLLLLISAPAVRQHSQPPLGTLSICYQRKSPATTARLASVVQSIAPHVVPLSLTVPLLHSHPFAPSSADSSSLEAGLLQLAQGTVLILDEDGMGAGGQLNQKALDNLKSLIDCVKEQRVRYRYPYMDDLKMDCAVRVLVLGQAKSLLPVDIHIPVQNHGQVIATACGLPNLRSYLARYGSVRHAAKLAIPEETGQLIQDSFVEERRQGVNDAEEALKRRMKVARLMALSYPTATLTREVWERAVQMDKEVTKRHA